MVRSKKYISLQSMAQRNLGHVPDEDLNDADVWLQDVVHDQEQVQDLQGGDNWDVPNHQNREPVEFDMGYGLVQPVGYDRGPQR